MISKDKQYKTRDGREVRIYDTKVGDVRAVHGAIKWKSANSWDLSQWGEDGRYNPYSQDESNLDLIEVKPVEKVRVCIWNDGVKTHAIGHTNLSHELGEESSYGKLIAIIEGELTDEGFELVNVENKPKTEE